MNWKTTLQVIIIIILLIIAGVLVYDSFWNKNQIQEGVVETVRENPFSNLIFPESFSPGSGIDAGPDFIYEGDEQSAGEVGDVDSVPEKPTGAGFQITTIPTSGWTTYSTEEVGELETTTKNYIRYVRIADGTVFDKELVAGSEEIEVVDRFIPNVERVAFSDNANNILFQYFNNIIESIETYSGEIEEIIIEPADCPFNFPIRPQLGDQSDQIEDLHDFLDRDIRTQIEFSEDDPRTEYTEQSDIAVKNFQTIYGLDIDGVIGPKTIAKMESVCEEQQVEIATVAEENLEKNYELGGYFLASNIYSVTVSPDGEEYFYLFEKDNESFGIIGNFLDTNAEQVFQSPLVELNADWINQNEIIISTKPSYYAPGYIFSLNPNTEEFVKIIGDRDGLYGKASPDGNYIFISYINDSGKLENAILNTETGVERTLPLVTLPDKCVWGGDNENIYCGVPEIITTGVYPDDWYKGKLFFNDNLWEINVSTLEAIEIPEFQNTTTGNDGLDIDMIDTTQDGDIIVRNKIDETLWFIPLQRDVEVAEEN